MTRTLLFACFVLTLGCTSSGERVTPRPLNDAGPPLPYAELLTRARQQATAATDAFYVNRWGDIEEISQGLEQTARFLAKAVEVPEKQKVNLPIVAADLGKAANGLGEAAKVKDGKKVQEALDRVHGTIYKLRLED